MKILERFKKAVDEHLSLQSFPVAIKLLERSGDIPPNMGRLLKALGESIRPCVGWHMARHKRAFRSHVSGRFYHGLSYIHIRLGLDKNERIW